VIRVLLADDQPLVRTGFRMILEVEEDIDVVPVQDGIAATALITAAGTGRVLVLTTFHLDESVVGALRAGASGFLLKDTDAAKLVEAIRIVHSGQAIVAPAVTRRLLDRFAYQLTAHQANGDGLGDGPAAREALDCLSAREAQVLALVARGLSNAEIAAALIVTEATVKSHVHHMLTKLGARVQLVVLAYEAGLAGRRSAHPQGQPRRGAARR